MSKEFSNEHERTSHRSRGHFSSKTPLPRQHRLPHRGAALLWYQDPKQYDNLLLQKLTEMSPKGAMNCIFVKNLVDHIWELRRMKKMKHVAINFVMPHAAAPLLAPTKGLCGNPDRQKVLWQAADAMCGIASEVEEGEMDFSERMASMSVEFIGGTGDEAFGSGGSSRRLVCETVRSRDKC